MPVTANLKGGIEISVSHNNVAEDSVFMWATILRLVSVTGECYCLFIGSYNNNNDNDNNNTLLDLICHQVAVVILHVHKI